MAVSELRFLSGNQHKFKEAEAILGAAGFKVLPVTKKIEELQTTDTNNLVRDKALKAYFYLGRPLFVEHTGLYLDHLNGFPGGLTQVFWDTLQADKFASLFGTAPCTTVVARTVVAYIDGKQIHVFQGEVSGNIVGAPRGDRAFQWDCVFMPAGESLTFAEMGAKKNDISMRRKAFDALAGFLKTVR